MLRNNFKRIPLKLQTAAFERDLQDRAKLILETAVTSFLQAAYKEVPVSTGMARASIRPLANYLKVNIPISPKSKSRIGKGEAKGSFDFELGPTRFICTFRSDVYHYWLNDRFEMNYQNGQRPTPWGSMGVGIQAFISKLEDQKGDLLPLLIKYLK